MSTTTAHHGILSTSQITWNAWEPGGEYTKMIKIKNIDNQTHKIQYKCPENKCFSTKYPQTITLCSGNTAKIPITFRPLEKEAYSDRVEFSTKKHKFAVSVKALLPRYVIDLPLRVQFGTCGVQSTVSRTFTLINKSIETYFKWDMAAPFSIEPALGLLPDRGSVEVTVKFSPDQAHVYDSTAVIAFGNGQFKKLYISGIGKHPFIMVGNGEENDEEFVHHQIDFGDVPIGTSGSKTFEVRNLSAVGGKFTVSHQLYGSVSLDKVFVCKKKDYSIDPFSSVNVKVDFLPTLEKMNYTDYFYITPAGIPSQCVVKCMGRSRAPEIVLNKSCLSFNYTELGQHGKQFITITNKSNVATHYQVVLDSSESVFKVDASCGALGCGEERALMFQFSPLAPIPYYKRVTILLHRQEPLFLDLLGSGCTHEARPGKVGPTELEQFTEKVRSGLSMYPPELQGASAGSTLAGVPPQDLPPCLQYFTDPQMITESNTVHVSLDVDSVEFGKCRAFQRVHHKTVTITNHTKGRITAVWSDNPDSVFTVLPVEMDIQPHKSASFRVNFSPRLPNQFYGSDLECTTFYKSMRDTQLVSAETVTASWCLPLYCTGETFEPGHEPFLPRYETDTAALLFPPAVMDQPVFRTLLLRNCGDTPMIFSFEDDPMGIFSVKPMTGVVHREVAVVMVRFLASQSRTYQFNLKCTLNTKHSLVFPCVAAVELPTAWLENENMLTFKQCSVGSVTKHRYGVRNTSRLPLRFEWRVPSATENVSVTPATGIILPNDTQYQTWSFAPQGEAVIRCSTTLNINHDKGSRKKMTLSVLGQGTTASLECLPKGVDFGITVVGEVANETISLHNPYSCTAVYSLSVEYDHPDDCCKVTLDKMSGSLAAFGKDELYITCQPLAQARYNVSITCTINNQSHTLLTLSGEGVFPNLSFIDVRSIATGEKCSASKKRVWDLFSLDLLNRHLLDPPAPAELRQIIETKSNEKRKPYSTKALAALDFGSNTVGEDPTRVVVVMKNSGKVPASFRFLFPPDLCLDTATWALDEVDDGELAQEKFGIEPRQGTIQPGQTLSLDFTYRHDTEGSDELPVLLKLSRGREIMLQLRGVTVRSGVAYPQIAHDSHTLCPVVIGSDKAPIQYYELFNGGDCQLSYEVLTDSLEQMREENYGCEILQCLQTSGRVQPHSIAQIPFVFSPLEQKTYSVEVPIIILGGETRKITIFGEGTLPGEISRRESDIPEKQAVLLKDQLAVLSMDTVGFGVVPSFSHTKKIIFVTNTNSQSVTFRWNTATTPLCNEVVSVRPLSGHLSPGASAMIEVALKPFSYPAIFDLDIICEVTDDTKEAEFLAAAAQYDRDLERERITFTILEPKPRTPDRIDKSMDNWVATETLNKYHTLPPIRALAPSPLDRPRKSPRNFACTKRVKHDKTGGESPEKEEGGEIAPPVPPKPFYLHLRITGEVADIKQFPDTLTGFDIPLSAITNDGAVLPLEEPAAVGNEVDTVKNVLSFILKSLLEDDDVHCAIRNLANEQIPYFAQIPTTETQEESAAGAGDQEGTESEPVAVSVRGAEADVKLAPILREIIGETLSNIIQETIHREVVLTARSRTIALPPRSPHH